MGDLKVLMFSKKRNVFCDYAEALLKSGFADKEFLSIRGAVGDHLDEELRWRRPEYILSFVCPWIITKSMLDYAQKAAVNFNTG